MYMYGCSRCGKTVGAEIKTLAGSKYKGKPIGSLCDDCEAAARVIQPRNGFLDKINEHFNLVLDACIGEAHQIDADIWTQDEWRYEMIVVIVDGVIGIRKDLSRLKGRRQ